MANAIPLLEGTNASGGYLLPSVFGPTLQRGINRESAVAALSTVRSLASHREKYAEYIGRPTAGFVAEGAAKGATGAEYGEVTLDVKKIATIVLYTEELLADAREDPTVLVNQDVRAAFSDLIDSHALGRNSSGTIVGQFNSELTETTTSVELANTGGDALAAAISSAMNTIESNGYSPTGIILANDGRAHLRNARNTVETAQPIYTQGFVREPDSLYGLPLRYSTNLQTFAGATGAGRVVGLVGDFRHAIVGIRNDVTVSTSNQASIDVGGTVHHLFQENKVAVRWEARVGFVAHDLNNAFVRITNAL